MQARYYQSLSAFAALPSLQDESTDNTPSELIGEDATDGQAEAPQVTVW